MDRDLRQLNKRQSETDMKKSTQFGLMDKTINELILLWINVNRDMWIEFELVFKKSINKKNLSVVDNLKNLYSKVLNIIYKNNRLFFFGIDIILVGIILYVCKIGR